MRGSTIVSGEGQVHLSMESDGPHHRTKCGMYVNDPSPGQADEVTCLGCLEVRSIKAKEPKRKPPIRLYKAAYRPATKKGKHL